MFAYTPHFVPSSIVLIGAGGTGSRLISTLAQLVRTSIAKYNPQAWIPNLPIYIFDGDKVEEKNLTRQNFIPRDVGQYKSVVLASRYSNAFGVNIYPSTQFVDPRTSTYWFIGKPEDLCFSFNNAVVILAVDSAKARRDVLQAMCLSRGYGLSSRDPGSRNAFIIDAGNEDAFGQIKFFTPTVIHPYLPGGGSLPIPKTFPKNYPIPYIPIDLHYYANLGESTAELSCVDLPQTLAINNMMAALICSVLQNFLYMKPMTYDGIRFGLDGAMYSELNTPRRWLARDTSAGDVPRAVQWNMGLDYPHNALQKNQLILAVEDSLAEYKKMGLLVDANGDLIPIPPKPSASAVNAPLEEALRSIKKAPKKKQDVTGFAPRPDYVLGGTFAVPVIEEVVPALPGGRTYTMLLSDELEHPSAAPETVPELVAIVEPPPQIPENIPVLTRM